jgi:hypothetical protein
MSSTHRNNTHSIGFYNKETQRENNGLKNKHSLGKADFKSLY